jgi:hypothetical protein
MPFPEHLVVGYWDKVCRLLTEQHGLTEEQARQEILDYRQEMESLGVGDILYHEDATNVAETLAGTFRQGGVRRIAAQRRPQKAAKKR